MIFHSYVKLPEGILIILGRLTPSSGQSHMLGWSWNLETWWQVPIPLRNCGDKSTCLAPCLVSIPDLSAFKKKSCHLEIPPAKLQIGMNVYTSSNTFFGSCGPQPGVLIGVDFIWDLGPEGNWAVGVLHACLHANKHYQRQNEIHNSISKTMKNSLTRSWRGCSWESLVY